MLRRKIIYVYALEKVMSRCILTIYVSTYAYVYKYIHKYLLYGTLKLI